MKDRYALINKLIKDGVIYDPLVNIVHVGPYGVNNITLFIMFTNTPDDVYIVNYCLRIVKIFGLHPSIARQIMQKK